MKYLRYLGVVIWKIIAKLVIYVGIAFTLVGAVLVNVTLVGIGLGLLLWMVVAYVTRKWSRSIVYSYTLENGVYLPRLTNDKNISIVSTDRGWELHSKKYNKIGFVTRKQVSWLKYQLVFWLLWGWVDDDCTRDTVAIGYGRDILEGKHFANAPVWFLKRIAKEQTYLDKRENGNAFALGETIQSNWQPILSTMWMFRNLAYNFNYSLEEIRPGSKLAFYYHNEKRKWHFGYIPDGSRQGRMVWFKEDYDKLYGVANVE